MIQPENDEKSGNSRGIWWFSCFLLDLEGVIQYAVSLFLVDISLMFHDVLNP